MSTSTHPLGLMQSAVNAWRDVLAKSVLFFFGIALWYKGLSFYAYYLLPLAWAIDGGLCRFGKTAREPLVIGMLLLCFVLALGILWSDRPDLGFKVWRRYFAFLVFIPYLGLLNKERLPWAIGGALLGYFGALLLGLYYWLVMGVQGIPALGMPYLHFSSMLGIGGILALYLASTSKNTTGKALFWALALFLIFIQFNQNARAILIATLISSVFLVFFLCRKKLTGLFTFIAILSFTASFSAYNSSSFGKRWGQAKQDIELLEQENFNSSIGYRFALWEVGIQGIKEHPLFGHGTGMAAVYFDNAVGKYKGGLYKKVLHFHSTTYHYHNDWIEIGMHVGFLGLMAYALLLWGWFQTLAMRGHSALAAALVSFIFMCGLADNLVFFRQIIFLLIVVTAIFILYKGIGNTSTRGFANSHNM